MAMELTGDRLIPASLERTWQALNDPEMLRRSIPGCESLERDGEEGFVALLALRVGPVNAKFKGKVRLSDVVPLEGYTLQFEGQGGVAGFGKGSAQVRVAAEGPQATRLNYRATATVGGKIAQVGARLVDATARMMAENFFRDFEAALTAEMPEPAPAESPAVSAASGEPAAIAANSRVRRLVLPAGIGLLIVLGIFSVVAFR
ncbi:CoxG family protein [Ramlibacter algicola]|uniref:Carbon monoxide dehydrogenase subunit G n=1 Tax=Ramlibacter algicola TaxID=2795217 RepID=A0A934Q0P4_9BURK|nr:carbon monoxide dehydrogenase subunit G [Ramlibacter algicola]MBK0392144.1 carbon monoxide dehydrogenase subunit G [Ramlibacter algicola]